MLTAAIVDADFEPAQVDEMAGARVHRERGEELAVAGALEDVAHAHALERAGLLLEEEVERLGALLALEIVDEADVAERGELAQLLALLLARPRTSASRRRTRPRCRSSSVR